MSEGPLVVYLVMDNRALGKNKEPVRVTSRNKQLLFISGPQREALCLAEFGGITADIDDHIKNLALQHGEKLGLAPGMLEVKTSQHTPI